MRKNDLQRDKAFRQRLAQKLEVEQPPESYFQAVQSAFASLPDELPVKARPIHQRVLRTCAALAACCAVVVAAAFGLNLQRGAGASCTHTLPHAALGNGKPAGAAGSPAGRAAL